MKTKFINFTVAFVVALGLFLFQMQISPFSQQTVFGVLNSSNNNACSVTSSNAISNGNENELQPTSEDNEFSTVPAALSTNSTQGQPSYATDHFLVALDDASNAATPAQSSESIKQALAEQGFRVTETVVEPTKRCGSIVSVEVPENMSVDAAVQVAKGTQGVSCAQFDNIYTLSSTTSTSSTESASKNKGSEYSLNYTPNDPATGTYKDSSSSNQYYLYGSKSYFDWSWSKLQIITTTCKGANVLSAWDVAQTNNSSTIAVLDTGVNLVHEDLQANINAELAYDTYNNCKLQATDSFNGDYCGHGTHVCGIAGATANNSVGIAGASYNASILPIKVFTNDSSEPGAYDSDIMQGYQYLFDLIDEGKLNNLHVINMSLGSYSSYSTLMQELITEAKERNILTVCAGGNGDSNKNPKTTNHYPSDYADSLAVTALDTDGTNANWSDYNEDKDISAPGVSIYSTYNDSSSSYTKLSGTSMASPLVAGIAALCFAAAPNATPSDVETAIKTTADAISDPNDSYSRWPDKTGSAGAINAAAAVTKIKGEELQSTDIDGVEDATYTGADLTPTTIKVVHNGTTLTEGSDYTLRLLDSLGNEVASIIDAGTYTVEIKGTEKASGYFGTATKTFKVVPRDILDSSVTVKDIESQTYNESNLSPVVRIIYNGKYLTEGTEYKLTFLSGSGETVLDSITDAGTYNVKIEGIGNFTSSVTKQFIVQPASVNNATISGITASFEYTGMQVEQSPTVTLQSGKVLAINVDYTLAYCNLKGAEVDPVNAGTYVVKIDGTGNYSGSLTAKFSIVLANLTDADVSEIENLTYTGERLYPNVVVSHCGIELEQGSSYTLRFFDSSGKECESVVDAGTYKAEITGIGNYTGTIVKKFVVEQPQESPEPGLNPEPTTEPSTDPAPSDPEPETEEPDPGQDTTTSDPGSSTTPSNPDPDSSSTDTDSGGSASSGTTTNPDDSSTSGGATSNSSEEPASNQTKASTVTRLAGQEAPQTSVAISQSAFDSASTVILCRSDDFKDAMSATGLAGVLDAPILLTDANSLTIETGAEIQRLGANTVFIIGGTGAIKQQVQVDASSIAGVINVERIYGEGAEDTSVQCAQRLANEKTKLGDTDFTKAIVSMCDNFQDALSISSFAYKYHVPILLECSSSTAEGRQLTSDAIKLFDSGGAFNNATVFIPGGTGAVSVASVEGTLGQRTYVRLTEGETGYDTSNYIANWMTTHGSSEESTYLEKNTAVVATGAQATKGVDALAGAALAGKQACPILLVNDNASSESVNTITINKFYSSNASVVSNTFVLGGVSVISDNLKTQLEMLSNT